MKMSYAINRFEQKAPKKFKKDYYEGVSIATFPQEHSNIRIEVSAGYSNNNCHISLLRTNGTLIDEMPSDTDTKIKLERVNEAVAEILRRNNYDHLISLFL